MVDCEGDVSEGWRRPDRFWGKVTAHCGHANTDYVRKAMYMLWYNGRSNIRENFSNRVAVKMETNNKKVSD